MTKTAIINASPLIFLSRGGQLGLLRHFADKILVPKPVIQEIRAKGPGDITAIAVKGASWLEQVATPAIPAIISAWGLGPGESSVLAIAVVNPRMEAIIDDLAGRRCAAFFNIPVRGTLGIVLAAKQRGHIAAARPVMEDLIKSGLYLSRAVLDKALQKVNE